MNSLLMHPMANLELRLATENMELALSREKIEFRLSSEKAALHEKSAKAEKPMHTTEYALIPRTP